MRPDGVRNYAYIFTNDVKVPEGHDRIYNGRPQVGVIGSEYYTLEAVSKGVTINDDGDAVATEPGVYEVRARIRDGYYWEITDPETGWPSRTTDDQIIMFTITKKDEPVKQYTITLDLNGGKLNKKTGKIKMVRDRGADHTEQKIPRQTGAVVFFAYY